MAATSAQIGFSQPYLFHVLLIRVVERHSSAHGSRRTNRSSMADGQEKVLVERRAKENLHCSTSREICCKESNLRGKNFRPLLQLSGQRSPCGAVQDPPRCWKCKASSHISSRCKSKASSSPSPTASAQPQLKYRPIFLSQTKPACSEMERHRSLGSAPTGTRSYRDGGAQFKIEDAGLRVKSVINFSGNPRFKPRVAFKLAATSWKMEDMNHQG
jgi:hypothetical protein